MTTLAAPHSPSPVLDEQCLVGHLFAAATPAGYGHLRALWGDAVRRWGASEPIGPASPSRHPALPPEVLPSSDGLICMAQATAALPGLHQMLLRRHRDRIWLSATLSPPDGSWNALWNQWRTVVDPDDPHLIGSAVLLTAFTDLPAPPRDPALPVVQDAVAAHFPAAYVPSARTRWRSALTGTGLYLTEPVAADAAASSRCLAVIAPRNAGRELDAWTWSDGTATPTPFARYLLHAVSLRLLMRGLDERGARAELLAGRVDTGIRELRGLLDAPADARLIASGRDLLVRTGIALLDLVTVRTRVAQDARDAEIVAHNLRLAASPALPGILGPAAPSGPPAEISEEEAELHPVQHDLYLSAALARRAEDLEAWLRSVEERAGHINAAAQTAVAEQLRLADEREARRTARFALRNTALVGALLMVLTTVQSLQYRLPLPGRVVPALIASLGGAALLLAGSTVRDAVRGSRREVPVFLPLSAGVLGAGLAWSAEGVAGWAWDAGPSPVRSLTVACAAALVSAVGTALTLRRRTPAPPSGNPQLRPHSGGGVN
ncbi:CATRA conflict system CASPASE/TPR repeat-associated protein [Streptomyces sp. NPDC051563]|uniref:CATRA conflict system CASPASE/TPR repeat-associated protein n=1 Tax=Streptomyces sp. NPDC051563 TaxID=3365659 RepID=UPI0037A8484B